ncbi:MAG: FmdB family zinc ribbon protein [Vicinamibacterales bacterium]
MPLYEYECDSCGNRFEKIQKFSDPLVDICPKCGMSVHKLVSSPAIQFKGSGFYITDYAKKESTPAGKTGGGKDKDSSSGSSSSESSSSSSDSSSGDKASAPSTPAPATPAKTATKTD